MPAASLRQTRQGENSGLPARAQHRGLHQHQTLGGASETKQCENTVVALKAVVVTPIMVRHDSLSPEIFIRPEAMCVHLHFLLSFIYFNLPGRYFCGVRSGSSVSSSQMANLLSGQCRRLSQCAGRRLCPVAAAPVPGLLPWPGRWWHGCGHLWCARSPYAIPLLFFFFFFFLSSSYWFAFERAFKTLCSPSEKHDTVLSAYPHPCAQGFGARSGSWTPRS